MLEMFFQLEIYSKAIQLFLLNEHQLEVNDVLK